MADRTHSRIDVAAAPVAVLDIIADFERYPEWVSQITAATIGSEDEDGWAREVAFTLDAGLIKDDYTLTYTWDIDEDGTGTVAWSLVRAAVLQAIDGSYVLTALPDGGTRVDYELAVDVALPLLSALKDTAELIIINTALRDLKHRAEG